MFNPMPNFQVSSSNSPPLSAPDLGNEGTIIPADVQGTGAHLLIVPTIVRSEEVSGINELTAPSPIHDPGRGEFTSHFGDEDVGFSTEQSDHKEPGREGCAPHLGDEEAILQPVMSSDRRQRAQSQPAQSQPTPLVPRRYLASETHFLLAANCWLVFFSIWGTLARLGFIAFTDYSGAPVGGGTSGGSGVLWANFAGCCIMGFLGQDIRLFLLEIRPKQRKKDDDLEGNRDKELEQSQPNAASTRSANPQNEQNEQKQNLQVPTVEKSSIPIYLGLTTGFCGSLTSFSSYMLQSFLYLANTLPAYTHPQKGYSVLSFLAYITITVCMSISGLKFGAHFAIFTQPYLPSISQRFIVFLDRTAPLWAFATWASAILMSIFIENWRGVALYACLFSPLGVLARFWASKFLNARNKHFPIGTFLVNIAGTAILAGVSLGQYDHHWPEIKGGDVGCQLLRGTGDGFCGCLTTVSTWVVEIKALKRRFAYRYALVSIIAGMLTMIIILGGYTWSQDGLDPANKDTC